MTLIETQVAPPGYGRLESDVPWDPDAHVEIVPPERVTMLEEWGEGAAGPTALSPVAITTPFRFLSDEGVAILPAICAELEQDASGDERIAKRVRGSIYRSEFLINYAPDDLPRNVDQCHPDAISLTTCSWSPTRAR